MSSDEFSDNEDPYERYLKQFGDVIEDLEKKEREKKEREKKKREEEEKEFIRKRAFGRGFLM